MSKIKSPTMCTFCPHFRHEDNTNRPMCSLSGIHLPSAFTEGCGIDFVKRNRKKKPTDK